MVREQSAKRVPVWAIALLVVVLLVIASFIIARFQIPVDGIGSIQRENGCEVTAVTTGGPAEQAGIKKGDLIIGVDDQSVNVRGHKRLLEKYRAGDSISYIISRDKSNLLITVKLASLWSQNKWYYLAFYSLIIIVCITSLYILYRKPFDDSAKIFFIFLQLFAVAQNQSFLYLDTAYALFATITFIFGFNLFGVVLLHFYLLFPTPVRFFKKTKNALKGIYLTGILFGIALSVLHIWRTYGSTEDTVSIFNEYNRWLLLWMVFTLTTALAAAIYQYIKAKNSTKRKQLRLVLIGSLFGLLPPIAYGLFPTMVWRIQQEMNMLSTIEFVNGVGTYIMTSFLALAIFRYRIWNLEIILRKAIHYVLATIMIVLLYVSMIAVINSFLLETNQLAHFVILTISILPSFLLRDTLQQYIDKLFYRESYESTRVVTTFEQQFAGVYQYDELASGIEEYLNGLFHFKSFLFALKEKGLNYKVAHQLGGGILPGPDKFRITEEIDLVLEESKVISVEEIRIKPEGISRMNGEILVPLRNGNQAFGFFILGRKMSDKSYTLQDVNLLSLLSCRIVSMFYTAKLYHNDLNRQLMLERERTRIARDIHDDVGASLTRISIMSDLVNEQATDPGSVRKWLKQISETSREVTSEMTQIIWALSPSNDTFGGLTSYVRRFMNEYLEPSRIQCDFTCPESLKDMALRAESRRNVFLSIREALHNVVKHSSAKNVRISFNREQSWVTVNVKDDGAGFMKDDKRSAGNGLINIRKRMKSIGGKAKILTEPGNGAEVVLYIPLLS